MNIVRVNPIADPLWRQFVSERQTSVFHSPDWMQVLEKTYGLEFFAHLILDDKGKPQAGLPLCKLDDLRGKRLVSLPFSDFCDPLVDTEEQWCALVGEALKEQCPVIVRCVHNPIPLKDERFKVMKQAAWHEISLEPTLDSLWEGMHSSARRATRKAERDGVVIKIAETEDVLRDFYEMYLQLRKTKYCLIAQPYSFFQNIWRQFVDEGKGFLMVAYHSGTVIGGIFFLEWQDTVSYKFNASLPLELNHRPNNLLMWEGIKYAKSRGYKHLDLGLSDLDQDGLVRYKRQFASDEQLISFLQYRPNGNGASQQDQELSRLLPQLTSLFTNKSVPNEVTEKAGELLYKFFA
jgi:CelD/BcsL family acetyltransferase involved in cellulose biosynthesis